VSECRCEAAYILHHQEARILLRLLPNLLSIRRHHPVQAELRYQEAVPVATAIAEHWHCAATKLSDPSTSLVDSEPRRGGGDVTLILLFKPAPGRLAVALQQIYIEELSQLTEEVLPVRGRLNNEWGIRIE